MLENLFNLVKEHAATSVINNTDVPNQHNNDVIAEATHAITNGLQSTGASGGGMQNILQLFASGNGSSSSLLSNPIVSTIISGFISKLTGNFGLNSQQANGVASSLIPNVLSSLIQKTNDPANNGFSMDGLQGLIGQFTQASSSTQQNNSGGSNLMDLIKGFVQ
jgi:hypothetical protein